MNNLEQIKNNCQDLRNSSKKIFDIYNIIFKSYSDCVMVEYPTMTRKSIITYKQIEERINKVAKAIYKECSIQNEYIALHGENSAEWIVAFWAILKSGNKPYLVNLRQPSSFSESVFKKLNISNVIYCDKKCDYNLNLYLCEDLEKLGADLDYVNLPEFADEFAISTSGTTLREKICIYNGDVLSAQVLNTEEIISVNPDIVAHGSEGLKILAFLPMYHIFGLEAMFLWFAFLGCTFVFLKDFAPENVMRTIRNHKVTHVFSVPMLWHAIEKSVRRELDGKDKRTQRRFKRGMALSLKLQNYFPKLGRKIASLIFKDIQYKLLGREIKFCISGGSFVKPSAVELLNGLGYPLYNGYGMTEVGICSVELGKRPRDRMLCSIGKPFESLETMIDDNNQLLLKGSSVCHKILIDGVENVNESWFATGDVIHTDEEGRIYIDGRVSDIVFGDDGENLNPDFAEQAFNFRDAVELSVLGNVDNSKLMLVVRVQPNMLDVQKNRLNDEIQKCNNTLPLSYSVKEIKFTYDPLIPQGGIKPSRAYIRKGIKDGTIKLFDFNDISRINNINIDSEIKQIIREMFSEILERPIEEIGNDMHFMNDLGGTSLDYFTLISEIDKRFDLRIDFGNEYNAERFGYTVNHFERMIKELIS